MAWIVSGLSLSQMIRKEKARVRNVRVNVTTKKSVSESTYEKSALTSTFKKAIRLKKKKSKSRKKSAGILFSRDSEILQFMRQNKIIILK